MTWAPGSEKRMGMISKVLDCARVSKNGMDVRVEQYRMATVRRRKGQAATIRVHAVPN